MDFQDANLKIQDFSFWPVFNTSNKFPGYFAVVEFVISRHIPMFAYMIYTVLYCYKLFLTNYVGLKIRRKVQFLQFLRFFHF